jgi:hypothetical protein
MTPVGFREDYTSIEIALSLYTDNNADYNWMFTHRKCLLKRPSAIDDIWSQSLAGKWRAVVGVGKSYGFGPLSNQITDFSIPCLTEKSRIAQTYAHW